MRVLWALFLLASLVKGIPVSQRRKIVQSFNVHRNSSSGSTPLQVGNGNFAFGADVTGLQTFSPFGILSTWCWHNFSLPTTPNQTSVDDFTGLQWWTHDRLITYDQPNPAQNDISTWLIQNPQRVNMARIGFDFGLQNVTEADLEQKSQMLDMWSGEISSSFIFNGSSVEVKTWAHPETDTVAILVESHLLRSGDLGIFLDFPLPDRKKFNAPFVGVFNETDKHETVVEQKSPQSATIKHTLDQTTYYTVITWDGGGVSVLGPAKGTHRYLFKTPTASKLKLTVGFSPTAPLTNPSPEKVIQDSQAWWESYWAHGAFIDLSAVKTERATELQRRLITSKYLLAVNSASDNPPQESGLVNNGWYGKFHLEMVLWNSLPLARWGHFPLLWRSIPNMYERWLPSSLSRANAQGYDGARWGKMTDSTGRSAPGEINSLLIWQQPHPMYFAEVEYRAFPNATTLARWDRILTATADFMASFAFFNKSKGVYDLGPPMYPVSENTNPNTTVNPTFELAYWRFGLDIASTWKLRQNMTVPSSWLTVRDNLAPLPVVDGAYALYQGIPGMWIDNTTTTDHPAMAGIFGLLPPPSNASGSTLSIPILRKTAAKIKETWALEESYGWDFSMLAMNSLRLGDVDQAVDYLLHPLFAFDDAGYPVGGSRVPTPYFPNSNSLLIAAAMMAGGWDGQEGPHFPGGWEGIEVEGFLPAM